MCVIGFMICSELVRSFYGAQICGLAFSVIVCCFCCSSLYFLFMCDLFVVNGFGLLNYFSCL